MGKSLADFRAVLAGKQADRKARQLSREEGKRFAKLEGMLDTLKRGENVQNRTMRYWLTDIEWRGYEHALEEQKELRAEFADKPTDLMEYERLMRDAMFSHNRADGYAGKGHHKTAQKFRYKAEVQFERALEHLEECLAADPQLQLWLDRNVDTGPECDVSPSSPVTMPRVVTSRSLDRAGSGFRQMYKSKRQLKIEVVEGAIDALKFED